MKKPIKYCKNPDCEDEILDFKSSKKYIVLTSAETITGIKDALKKT